MEKKQKGVPTWLVVAVGIALAVCLARINSLKSDIELLQNTHRNEISALEDQISAIYDNVDTQLKQQASLLSDVQYRCGEMDPETNTVPVSITVVPKVITDDMRLSIALGEEMADCTRKGNAFSAELAADLFLDYNAYPMLSIRAGGETKTESLETVAVANLWSDCLPSISANDIYGRASFDGDTLNFNTELVFDWFPAERSDAAFSSFALVVERNGEEIDRRDITQAVMASESYADGTYVMDFTESYPVSEGDKLKVYIVAEDTLGYVHRTLAHFWFQSNGATAETVYGGETIYDSEGNPLYGGKE